MSRSIREPGVSESSILSRLREMSGKKTAAVALSVAMAGGLSACNGNAVAKEASAPHKSDKEASAPQSPGPVEVAERTSPPAIPSPSPTETITTEVVTASPEAQDEFGYTNSLGDDDIWYIINGAGLDPSEYDKIKGMCDVRARLLWGTIDANLKKGAAQEDIWVAATMYFEKDWEKYTYFDWDESNKRLKEQGLPANDPASCGR